AIKAVGRLVQVRAQRGRFRRLTQQTAGQRQCSHRDRHKKVAPSTSQVRIGALFHNHQCDRKGGLNVLLTKSKKTERSVANKRKNPWLASRGRKAPERFVVQASADPRCPSLKR